MLQCHGSVALYHNCWSTDCPSFITYFVGSGPASQILVVSKDFIFHWTISTSVQFLYMCIISAS